MDATSIIYFTSNVLDKLKSKVFVGIFANKVTNLKASGVPPYVILNHRLCELECNLVRIEGTIVKEIQSLPTSVCDEVLKHCSVNGAVPISADQVTTMMTNMQVQLLVNIRKEMQTFAVAAGLSVQAIIVKCKTVQQVYNNQIFNSGLGEAHYM